MPSDYVDFTIIIPKQDNSGCRFTESTLNEIREEIANEFGGITIIPETKGCYYMEETDELVCEGNEILKASAPKTESARKRAWLEKFAKKIGKELGQKAIFLEADDVRLTFVPGLYKERVPERTTTCP